MSMGKGFLLLVFGVFFCPGAWAFEVEVADAPDNALNLTLAAISGATQKLKINIYELKSPTIAQAIIDRIKNKVSVQVLVEGQPTEGLSSDYLSLEAEIVQAMRASHGTSHYYVMKSGTVATRRFHYDHAKYAVIDEASLLVGSENYSPPGQPAAGAAGNRGWEVLVHDATTAKTMSTMFDSDSSTAFGDVTEITASRVPAVLRDDLFHWDFQLPPDHVVAPVAYDAAGIKLITSPQDSLAGLLDVIASSTDHVELELLSLPTVWGNATTDSPLVKALIDAAGRGVHVRVLLNDDNASLKPGQPPITNGNKATVDKLVQTARENHLSLEAMIANLKAMGVDNIHNDGILSGTDKTLVSSINWNEDSVSHNREAAVLIQSPQVHDYFSTLFEHDWKVTVDGASQNPPPSPR